MLKITPGALAILLLSAPVQAAHGAPKAPTLDPRQRICANGYIRTLEVSGVEDATGAGAYPWLRVTVDQTGFAGGGTAQVTAMYHDDSAGVERWSALLDTVQQAYLSRASVVIYNTFSGGSCQDFARNLTVQLCLNEVDCKGVTAAPSPNDADEPTR